MKQNINYIGSKYSLLPFIEKVINENIDILENKVFCDLFSGSGIVSRYFSNKFKKIISNDIEYYSYVILKAYLQGVNFEINYLNDLPLKEGFIFENYSEAGKSNRLYFSSHNGKKIDSIREEIEKLDPQYYYVALCSLLEASDKVANTTSVYGAFLKKLKNSAIKNIHLNNLFLCSNKNNEVYNKDANVLIKEIKGDVLYLDPPYNSRQYSGNYHLLNTIAKNDNIIPIGVTGQRNDNFKSKFCSKIHCENCFEDLIKNSNFTHILVSYNNEGIISSQSMEIIMKKYGEYKLYSTDYKTYKADDDRNNKSKQVKEYIHYLRKI